MKKETIQQPKDTSTPENENLQKLADLLEDRGLRKYLNINMSGYSQIERDIVELLSPKYNPAAMEELYKEASDMVAFFQQYVPLRDCNGKSLSEDWDWSLIETALKNAKTIKP